MTISTLTHFPQHIMDQLIAKYGKPTYTPKYLGVTHDGGNIPVAYASIDDARSDGWRPDQLRKGYLKEWPDQEGLDSDLSVLSMALYMEECPARQTYIRKARERGYSVN